MHINLSANMPANDPVNFDTFLATDIRSGTIVDAQLFPEARNPSYILKVDLGPAIGIKKSAAQITHLYTPEKLIGERVMAVVNFPPRQIGPVMSEVLVLGCADADGHIVLVTPKTEVPNGARLV